VQDRSAAGTLATYSTQVDASTLPPAVVAKAKLNLLDCLAACVTAEMGLRSEPTRNAISLASNTAGGLNAWAQAGTEDLVFHSGYAARNGVLASMLAQRGVVGPEYIFEGKAGLLEAFDARDGAAALVAHLGERYEILSIVHKPAPACIFAQGPSQVAQALVATERFDPASIESVDVHVSRPAALYPGCDNQGPMERKAAAQMSIQFCVASILATGAIRDANWANYRDGVTNALAARCRVIADEALTEMFPAKNGTRIAVRLRDGRAVTSGQDDFRSMTDAEIIDRFLHYADDALGRANAEAIVELILRLETVNDLGPLFQLLRH
jgi:2-methylcitrate dehydratase PrpD